MEYVPYNATQEESLRFIAQQLAKIAANVPDLSNHQCTWNYKWEHVDELGFISEVRPYALCDLCEKRQVTKYKIVIPHWFNGSEQVYLKGPLCLNCKNKMPNRTTSRGICTCVQGMEDKQ